MKKKYLFIILILILGFVWFAYLILCNHSGENAHLGNLIQGSGVFVALLTAVIALSVADPRKKQVKIKIELSTSNPESYSKSDLSEELKETYKNFPDSFESCRVEFKMVNNSGFTLKKPVLTFKLPIQKQHPYSVRGNWDRTFRSNLFNSSDEIRLLEFADTCILSNSNLPYWNNKDEMTIWIRMCFGLMESFIVEVSINCENAEGITKKIEIRPIKSN